LLRDTFFYGSGGAQVFGAFDDAHAAPGADPDPAAGVAEGGIGAARGIEKRFVRFRIRGLVEGDESDVHKELIEPEETFECGRRLLQQTWRM